MNLVVTIDTEGDQWNMSPAFSQGVRNVQHLPALQALFDEYNVTPTYLVDYPVASTEGSASVLRRLLDRGTCEVGSHCHPWTTPPFRENGHVSNSMLCNLPTDLLYEKLQTLHEAIVKNTHVTPLSFRAGRWGYGPLVAPVLAKLGYRIDTSITPLTDWSAHHGPDFSNVQPRPYHFCPSAIYRPDAHGTMLEVPATIDFTWRSDFLGASLTILLNRLSGSSQRLRAHLTRLRFMNRTWLSPESSTTQEMVNVTKALHRAGIPLANLFFHSSSLQPGLTPFVRTEDDKIVFLKRLRDYLTFSRSLGLRCLTLSEALAVVPREVTTRSMDALHPPGSGPPPEPAVLPKSLPRRAARSFRR